MRPRGRPRRRRRGCRGDPRYGASALHADDVAAIDELRGIFENLQKELSRVIVGQSDVIERLSICLFARGHALLMGVPGLAKTMLVSRLAETMKLDFSRIQFTPALMPMDITGTEILQEGAAQKREFEFVKGPVFANVILADEINRAPASACTAFFRFGHAKPYRAGRNLPASRSPA